MERLKRVYNNPLYRSRSDEIRIAEREREYCCHDLQHALDVARIGYIKILEDRLDIDKELFYTASLLHDIGRCSGKPHAEKSAELAEIIMRECDFSENEINLVATAILGHSRNTEEGRFSKLLYYADKKSRLCMECAAADSCYWELSVRNLDIEV